MVHVKKKKSKIIKKQEERKEEMDRKVTDFCQATFFFWLRWVFVAARRLSLVAVSGGYSLWWCTGFSLLWLLLLRSTGSRPMGFSSCGSRALGTWAQ